MKIFATIIVILVISIPLGLAVGQIRVDSRLGQTYVEGMVKQVEFTQETGGSGLFFGGGGIMYTHIYFSDGRTISFPGILPPPKTIVIGKFNRIWFDKGNDDMNNITRWIRDVEILKTPPNPC